MASALPLIHIFWDKGWDNAPPKAKFNLARWKRVGAVHAWDEDSAREHGLLPDSIPAAAPPALKCDVTLAAAQYRMGGLAVGADMEPLRADRIRRELEVLSHASANGKGMVIYATWSDTPYTGFSWFPQGNAWIQAVSQAHGRINWNSVLSPFDVGALSGPRLWRYLIPNYLPVWLCCVRTYAASRVFKFEKPTPNANTPGAWVDPGLGGDWFGDKPEVWQ